MQYLCIGEEVDRAGGVDMSEQELKRLKRSEILEIMIDQTNAVKVMRLEMSRLEEQAENYKAKISEQNETISRLRSGIVDVPEEFEAETARLKSQLEDCRAKISEQNETIARLKADPGSRPAPSGAETEQLKSQLEEYKAKISEQNETITRLRTGLVNGPAESEEESRQMDLVYKQIEQKLKGQRARIKELEAEVRKLRMGQADSNVSAEDPGDTTTALNTLLEDARRAKPVFRHARPWDEKRK